MGGCCANYREISEFKVNRENRQRETANLFNTKSEPPSMPVFTPKFGHFAFQNEINQDGSVNPPET